MRMRAWVTAWCGCWLATSCTRDNPAFAETEDPPGTTATSVDDGRTDGATGASATGVSATVASAADAPLTGVDATSLDTGGPTSEVTSDTNPGDTQEPSTGTTGEPEECVPDAPNPITIRALALDELEFFPPLCSTVVPLSPGPIMVEGDNILQRTCGSCGCAGEFGVQLEFDGTLTPPDGLPECGRLVYWAGPDGEGGCRWEGFAVLDASDTTVPYFLGANSRNLPAEPFGPVAVAFDDSMLCINEHACADAPGRHALVFADDTPVPVGPPVDVLIDFEDPTLFSVTNRMAFVAPMCDEQVAWEARNAS